MSCLLFAILDIWHLLENRRGLKIQRHGGEVIRVAVVFLGSPSDGVLHLIPPGHNVVCAVVGQNRVYDVEGIAVALPILLMCDKEVIEV